MLTRKDFIQRADTMISAYKKEYMNIVEFSCGVDFWCKEYKLNNPRFDEKRFREYLEKGIHGTVIQL